MKFTFASLLLVLVHALIGVPLSAQSTRDMASAEVNPAFGIGKDAAPSKEADELPAVTDRSVARAYDAAMFAATIQARPIPAVYNAAPLPGEHSFALPLKWGAGDRLALDEGKP